MVDKLTLIMTISEVEAMLRKGMKKDSVSFICSDLKPIYSVEATAKKSQGAHKEEICSRTVPWSSTARQEIRLLHMTTSIYNVELRHAKIDPCTTPSYCAYHRSVRSGGNTTPSFINLAWLLGPLECHTFYYLLLGRHCIHRNKAALPQPLVPEGHLKWEKVHINASSFSFQQDEAHFSEEVYFDELNENGEII